MRRQVLYIYVDGNDLDDVAARIEHDLEADLSRRTWSLARPSIVNQQHQPDETVGPDDFPDWDLGVNLALPDAGAETPGWFTDVEYLVRCFATLSQSTGREFVLGIYDTILGVSDDLVSIDRADPDIEEIRAAIGVGPTTAG